MPGVKFTVDVDAAKGVTEFLRLRAAEKQVGDGLKDIVVDSKAAGAAMSQSARQGLREYELAEKQMTRAMPAASRMIGGGGFVAAPRRGGSILSLAPLASAMLRPGAATVPTASGTGGLELARTEAEVFSRFLRAQEIRAGRNAERLQDANFLASVGPGAGNMQRMDNLLGQGQRSIDAGKARHAQAWDADMQQRAVAQSLSMNNMETKLAVKQQTRDKAFRAAGVALGVVTAGVMELSQATERYTSYVHEAGAAGIQFEGDIRGLLSLGDNTNRSGSIRSDILAKSAAYGIDTSQVANAQFMLNSAASNLGAKTRGDIMNAGVGLNQVAGGDLQAELVAVTKLMQTYGGSLGSADMAASKLLATEDKAAITLGDLAQLLPDVLPAAKLMGHTYDEIAASVITATQVLGNNDKTLTGLRNTFLKLGEAQQAGLVHQGTFIEQFQELSNVPAPQLEKIFGERTVSIVAALADHVGDLTAHLKEMSEIKAGGVMQKFLDEQADPNRRDADTGNSLDQSLANIPKIRFQNPEIRDADMRLKAAKLGYEGGVSPTLAALTPDWAKNFEIAEAAKLSGKHKGDAGYRYSNDDWVKAGFEQLIGDKVAAGDAQSLFEANTLRLRFGSDTDTKINGKATGETEANEYVSMSKKAGGDIGLGRYEQYRRDELAGDSANMKKDMAEITAAIKANTAAAAAAAKLQTDAADKQQKAAKDNQRGVRDRNAHTY